MVPSNERKKSDRIPQFDGKTMGISEFLERFETESKVCNWSDDVKRNELKAHVTGEAYALLTSIPVDGKNSSEVILAYQNSLLQNFGLSPEQAFAKLCDSQYQQGEKSIIMYSNTLSELIKCSFPSWEINHRNELACKFFWKGLPHTSEVLNAMTLWKSGTKTLSHAVEIVMPLFMGVKI